MGARAELVHLLANLLVNARDAMPAGGRIEVAAALAPEGGGVELTVSDEGPGVAPGDRERVFEAFYTTKGERGLGLGLKLARDTLTRFGGSIRVTDGPGGGARFVLHFPIGGEEAERP
jgi:signal transduction histidine kinase